MSMSITSLYYGGGINLGVNISISALAGSVGTIFAIAQAEISKVLFEPYHNIDSLANTFPSRVQIVGSSVRIRGPVLINGQFGGPIIAIAISSVVSVACYFLLTAVAKKISNLNKDKNSDPQISRNLQNMVYIATGLTTCLVAYFIFTKFPIEPGVHLLDWTFNKIN